MRTGYDRIFKRPSFELFAGDYYATKEKKIVLVTLLGSCISVCLKDRMNGVVGMNHFMLPDKVKKENMFDSADARYGLFSMEKMINKMMKLGASKNYLEAKIFGGGKVLQTTFSNVAATNIEFAKNFLDLEGIPIIAENVGGQVGRKIYFIPETFDIYVKKIEQTQSLTQMVNKESSYFETIRTKKSEAGELTLFD